MFTIGFELEFAYPGKRTCPDCWGHGHIDCPECWGNRKIACPYCDGLGCENCVGTGEIECTLCEGAGYIQCETCEGAGHLEAPTAAVEALKKMEALGAELTYDCSIASREAGDDGRELRSPVFDFRERASWQYFIEGVTALIKEGGGASSPMLYCGLHVHVRPYEYWADALKKRLYSAWFNWAEKLFIRKFRPARRRLEDYCRPWQVWAEDLTREERQRAREGEFVPYWCRYMTLNICSLDRHATLEFRLFNGTLDPGEIKEALTWVGALTEAVLLYDDPDEIKKCFEEKIRAAATAAAAAVAA